MGGGDGWGGGSGGWELKTTSFVHVHEQQLKNKEYEKNHVTDDFFPSD